FDVLRRSRYGRGGKAGRRVAEPDDAEHIPRLEVREGAAHEPLADLERRATHAPGAVEDEDHLARRDFRRRSAGWRFDQDADYTGTHIGEGRAPGIHRFAG